MIMKKGRISLDDVILIEESTITVRGYRRRITIPSGIFKNLKLKDKDTLRWVLLKNNKIIIQKKK